MKTLPRRNIRAILAAVVAASAILSARANDLSIAPATLPDGMEGVPYRQILFVEGGDRSYYDWQQVSASWTTAACSYQVSANETPLWDGRKSSGNVAYDLPFAFPFCGKTYDKVYVTTKGLVLFRNSAVDQNYVGNSELYYKHGFAPFWCDTSNVEGYVDTSVANEVSFRFESFSTGTGTWAVRMTMKKDGTVRYAYRQDGNTFNGRRVVGVGYDGTYSDYVTVGAETAGIPATDIAFDTYGLPDGLQFRENGYQDPDTRVYGSVLTGTLNEACDVKFAVRACTNYVGVATNFYHFSIVRNPNRPPVIDAFTPADTNAVIFLDLGDTATFNVAVTDEAGDPFDVKWEFMSRDYEYASRETVGTETNLVFEATQARYEMQNSNNQPILRCTVSDECWTNTVTWKVNIRRDWYVDAAADPAAADGSAEHPWPRPHIGGLQRGDTVTVAPGTYVWGPSDSTQIGVAGGATFRSTGSAADTKFVFQQKGYIHGAYNNRTTFQGFAFDGITFYGCDLVDCEIRNYDSANSYDGAIRCCSLVRCYVTGGTGKFHCLQSDIVDSTLAGNAISVPSTEGSARAVGEDCTLTRSIVVNNLALDGVEANVITDTTYASTAVTNSCTIPAMTTLGPGNYEAQPTFVSLAGGDLRLRAGSACIDADDPANNTGAYKGPGVEGFVVHAVCDPVRGTVGSSDGEGAAATSVVASGGSVTLVANAITNRAFLGWTTNGVDVAAAPSPSLTLENIDCDYEVEAIFEVREFWVNPTEADDAGDGSAATPKKTIAAAAALAIDGETIRLAEGTFEPFALLESSKVTLLGAGPDKTFIDGGGTNWCVRLGSKATLKNVAVVNGNYTSWSTYAGGVNGGTIENCVVSNCVSSQTAGGVYDATVVSCLITGNTTGQQYGGSGGGVVACKVYNSTIVGNVHSFNGAGGASGCYLFNNIITGSTASDGGKTYDISNPMDCNLRNGVSSNEVYSANLIGTDPWFVDAANGDYRLTAGSPAIDAGGEVLGFDFAHATDLAGDRRIRGAAVDYGCYEGGVVTGAPAAPVATGTSAKAAKGIPLSWAAVANAAEYRIYRGTTDDAAAATKIGSTTATNYLDTTAVGGTDYFYWVSAYANATYGESAKCAPIAATAYAELKIETASLPGATEAVPYSAQLECSGNVGAATWSLPYAVYTRGEGSTFDGSVGVVIGDDWPEKDTSYQHNPIVTLPFSFTWFGEQYDKVRLSSFGALYFGVGTGVSLSWSTWAIDDEPKIVVNEGPYSSYYYVETSEFRVDSQADHVTIVWKGTCHGKTVEFSATLNSDNTVRLAYGSNEVGAYVAYSNGSADTVNTLYRAEGDFSNADDYVITCLPNESHLALSEGGLLSGVENDAGTYAITALVTDGANGDTAWKIFTLTVAANANTRPVVDTTSPATGTSSDPAADIPTVIVPAGDSQAFAVTAHDPEGAALHYDWYLDDTPVSSAGASWTYAPAQSDIGRHSLVCEVSDSLWTNGQVYAVWDVYVGQKLYVDAVNGTTNGTGTSESPFKTLQQAEEWMGPGATVFVAPGTYAPIRVWGGGFVAVTFRATGSAAETIIDGGGNRVCVDDWNCTKEFTFVGFTLRNGGDENQAGTASYGVNLKDCVVTGCKSWRCTVYGADVENCQIYGNTSDLYGAAFGFCNAVNSLIYGNTAGGTGVVYRSTLDHCTVYGNTAMVGGGLDATSTADHSIVWGNTATADASTANYVAPTGGVQFTVSCTTPLPAAGEGNIAQDPQFVDAAGGDFRLADGSPCKEPGMGYSATGVVPVGTTYTVTFDANGGTPATTTRSVAKGKALGTLPAPTRAGYTLAGWFTAKSGGTQVTAETKVSKDVTYYARWTAKPKYTVTFNANGGTSPEASRQVAQGEAIGELPAATRGGWALVGWFTAKTGGTEVTAATTISKATTVYARWTEHYELVVEAGVLTGLTGTTPATVDVPATVTAFAAGLFQGVTKITAATGGANVTACGAGAFRDTGLWAAAPNGPVVVCGVLVGYKGTVPATVDVPAGVRVIADGAFAGAANLAEVYLPDSLAAIGAGAFADCPKLDEIHGLDDVATVAADAFSGSLFETFRLAWSGTVVTGFKGPIQAEIVIPANATGIAMGAFSNQTAITSVVVEGTNAVTIGNSAFEGCANLATVSVGGPAKIGANAFLNCTSLTNAGFGGIPSIGARAFEGCALLAAIELPETLADIGAAAFKDCATLADIHLPASLVTMGEYAFAGCAGITNVTGGDGLLEIRKSAFDGTAWYDAPMEGDGFTEVVLGHVLLKIRGVLPASYEISTNVTMVSSEAFLGQTTLSDLYIGTEVAGILDRAFAGCTSLGSVTVPSGCRDFGDYLFDGCTSLTNVYFRGHAPTNDIPHVFAGTPETLKVHIKEGSRGWEYPGADSDFRPERWPYQTENDVGWAKWKRVSDDLNRAVYEAEPQEGVLRSVLVDGMITNDTTWTAGKVYEIQYNVLVATNVTLTIEAGTIIKMPRSHTDYWFGWVAGSAGMTVEGHLQINGTKANPVVFTSAADDTWGGDTNGDGNRSEPQPGDSGGVYVDSPWGVDVDGVLLQATVDATYAKFMYGEMGSVSFEAGFCVAVSSPRGQPCRSVFRNCEFSHATQVGVACTGASFENCIFTDCDRGIMTLRSSGPTRVVNSVVYGNRIGFSIDAESLYVTNSIIAFNTEAGLGHENGQYSGDIYATRCCLWNPGGVNTTFPNQGRYIYNVDNIEADPLFLDPENGDFRISVDSPCVDAAFGAVAPEYDSYEQPRMDVKYVRNTGSPNAAGEYPDIGIYEVPGTTERPVMNLEVENVAIVASGANSQLPITIAPGETLTVTYTVRNTGTAAAKGSIRDTVRIKSAANGGTMVAGTVTQLYDLGTNATATFTARVAVPAAPAGGWFVGIDVNPNRDVFEQNMQRNSLWTEDAIEVALPEMGCGGGALAVAVPAGSTMGYILSDLPEEGGVVVITTSGGAGVAPVVARVATGHMPTAAMNDATSFVRNDGALAVVIPPRASTGETPVPPVYLALENIGVSSATVNVAVQPLATDLWSVYPETVANVGDMGFTFTGAGLTAESAFYLGGIRAKSATAIDSASVYAVFDVQNVAADRYYDASADGKVIKDAVYVNKVAKGPILDAKLELPERTRDNRVYTGYVVYENKGDTQMNAPTFIVDYAGEGTNTVFGAYDDDNDDLTQQRVLIVGIGTTHPAGVLKPGDWCRLPFKFKPVGDYRFKLDPRYTSDEVASAATRLNLRGRTAFDGYAVRGLANLLAKGEPAAAVSGHLLDVRTREPLAGAALKLALAGDASFARVVTTDADGYFQFEQLRDGSYELVADKGYALATTNRIAVAGQADVNGYEALALPPGTISGYVMAEDGSVVQYGAVTLFKSENDMEGETVATDGYGAYRFAGLEDGEYAVYARPYEAFKGLLATNAVVSAASRDLRVDFALPEATRAYGAVTLWKGGAAGAGEVRFYREDGNYLKAEVSTNGTWEAQGLAPGEYSVAYVSADGTFESGFAEVSLAKGDETEIPLQALPATPFELSTTFGVIDGATYKDLTVYFAATGYASDTNVASVVWDFGDGSGTFETNAVETAHTYTSTGLFAVSVTPKYEDGTLGNEFVLHNCLCITNELETIYKANAIVLGGYATQDADDRKDAGTLVVTGVGEDFVKLSGAPGAVPLAVGTVIAGPCKDENGEDDWILRKIVGVTGDETSGWTLATEHGNEEDLYEQYWFYGSAGVEEKAPTRGAPTRGASPKSLSSIGDGVANLLKKTSGSIEKGIEFEVDCSPDLHYHYSCKITSNDWRQVWKTFRNEDVLVWENLGPRRRELHIWGDVSLKADITATAEFKGGWEDEQEYELVPKAVSTLPSAAKAIPYFKIGYSASGTVSGEATATAEVKGHLNVGFVKESDKKIQWHKTKPFDGDVEVSFDADEGVDAAVKLAASVSAGFGVKVKAFEVVSASADVTFNATAAIECPKNSPSKASASIGYDTNVSMNFIDLSWLNKDWKVGMDWSIEGPTLWSVEWISAKPKFIYRQPHAKEWPARITVTDRSERGTYADARGRTFPIPIESVTWDYGQGQTFSYGRAQIESGEYKKHRIIEFPEDQEEGEYVVSLNVQGGIAPSLWPCQKKIKIKKPDEPEEQTKIQKEEWFSDPQNTQQSYDPNEMAGPLGSGAERYVRPGQQMTYTIYFENKKDAGIAAQEVWVDNRLSEYLDWSTFEMGEVSIAGQTDYGLADKTVDERGGFAGFTSEIDQTNGLYRTRTRVDYNPETGLARWYIRVVDPSKTDESQWPDDPDAGVLQPNAAPPEGEGHFTYRVNVRADAPANAVIVNTASIVFDSNAAIETDPAWWNTVYEMTVVKVTVDGVETNMTLAVGEPYGSAVPPNPAAKKYYSFGGWYTGPNGTGRRVTAASLVQSGDSGLYPYWKAVTWGVVFNANGGKGKMAEQLIKKGVATKLTANAFTRSGYTFIGWSKTKTGKVAYANKAAVKDLVAAGKSVTLYAQWAVTKYKVAFNGNGGKAPKKKKMKALSMTYGTAKSLPKNIFTRKNYVFIGWSTSKKGPAMYANKASVKNLTTKGGTVTLYAQWAKKSYKVAFVANGGKGKMAVQAMTYGKATALAACKFTRKGYTFAGWATSAANAKKGKVAFKNKKKVKNLVTTGKAVKLYAVWKKK